jgi:hypothetical protein
MKKTFLFAVLVLVFVRCETPDTNTESEVKASWSSSAQYASWANGGYTVYNNIWGSGAGSQSIWANTYSQWGVWANHPNSGGIKSYPNSTKYIGKKISAINTLSTSFNATTPAGGAWESCYDLWDSNNANEIMLWMNYTGTASGSGNVKPISYNWSAAGDAVPVYTNQSIGGHTWNVFRGNNGSNNVYSFLRTSKTNSGTIDAKAIFNWIKAKGWIGDVTVGNIQYGFEITSSYGTSGAGLNFTCNSYSVTSN